MGRPPLPLQKRKSSFVLNQLFIQHIQLSDNFTCDLLFSSEILPSPLYIYN